MDKKELFDLADALKADAERRARLLRWIGNRTEVEMFSICGKSAAWYYLFREYPESDKGQKEFLRFLCAADWRRNHYSHNAKFLAAMRDERDARKNADAKKTLQDRISDVSDEIDAYRQAGLTWGEIAKKLKKNHRNKFYKIKLPIETLRKYFRKAKEKTDG